VRASRDGDVARVDMLHVPSGERRNVHRRTLRGLGFDAEAYQKWRFLHSWDRRLVSGAWGSRSCAGYPITAFGATRRGKCR
jgi:hypothetical protein